MSIRELILSEQAVEQPSNFTLLQSRLAGTFPEFCHDTSDGWQDVICKTNLIEIPVGQEIMSPVTACDQFTLILEGKVRVFQHTPDDREMTLYRLGPGDLCVLSINGLLRRKPYGAFARTETAVKALAFSRELFFEAMAVSELFRNYVLISISDRFHDLLELMETTIFESLDTRLICLLSKMSRLSSTNTIHITHQDLARELGTSREVISRVLKGLERKGCISLARGTIQFNV